MKSSRPGGCGVKLRFRQTDSAVTCKKMWPDIRDSAWIGGGRDGWERVPYWLDGFVPMAYLLESSELIATARHYIGAILERQKEDGWLCPCTDSERGSYDMWAHQYGQMTNRVECAPMPSDKVVFMTNGNVSYKVLTSAPVEFTLKIRIPDSREPISEIQKVKLIPYGCTGLRMTEVPYIG